MPTRREWEEHKITHIPFRAWCRQCVEGKADSTAHRKSKLEESKQINRSLAALGNVIETLVTHFADRLPNARSQ